MAWLEPVALNGTYARLEPLSQDHRDDLETAVKDGELWKLWYTSIAAPEKMQAEIERRLKLQAAGAMLPFVLKRLGADPATSSAPFVATLVDVTGIVIYFTVASVILRGSLL